MTLEQERTLFKQNRFIAMPLAGTIVWALIGLTAPFVSEFVITWMIYIGTGAIFYLGAGLSYLTGERFFAKDKVITSFDRLFFVGLIMSLMVFAIALPVAAIDHSTVPLSIGILAGLMWMPLSWAIEHWVGYFHTISRTLSIVTVWYLFPDARVEAISAAIVIIYIISLYALEQRYRLAK
ncbi:DUF7010 family protein [Alteromonas gracilis]|uniref:DUF7010 family protein n=1 Tax=Alteromonas gracilis TaxID=1479524 RepID=UPI003D65A85E